MSQGCGLLERQRSPPIHWVKEHRRSKASSYFLSSSCAVDKPLQCSLTCLPLGFLGCFCQPFRWNNLKFVAAHLRPDYIERRVLGAKFLHELLLVVHKIGIAKNLADRGINYIARLYPDSVIPY